MDKIGFLGVGKMGEAILGSLIRTAGMPLAVIACDRIRAPGADPPPLQGQGR